MAKEEDTDYPGWYACDISGYQPYVPAAFVHEGALTRNYNPTELIPQIGDVLEIQEIVNAWLLAKNTYGIIGWIPAECVVSLNNYQR